MAHGTGDKNDISTAPSWHESDQKRHRLARALRAGPEKIREAALNNWLIFPNPGDEEVVEGAEGIASAIGRRATDEVTQFDLRIARSDFAPNAWADTIEEIARTPFKSQVQVDGWDEEIQGVMRPKIGDDGDPVLDAEGEPVLERVTRWADGGRDRVAWSEEIDLHRTLHDWAEERLEDGLFEGITLALIDNDPREFPSTAARVEAGARPRVRTFRRKDFWTFSRMSEAGGLELAALILNRPVVTEDISDLNSWSSSVKLGFQLILAPEPGADPGSEEAHVRSRIFVKESETAEFEEIEDQRRRITPPNGDPLDKIPTVPFYGTRTGFFRGDSPFLRTAESQMVIANLSSELENNVRELLLTIIFGAGFNPDKAKSQPTGAGSYHRQGRFITTDNDKASLSMNQPSSGGLVAAEAFIDNKAEAIRRAHRSIHSATPTGPVTAREITVNALHASSQLEMWVRMHEAGWTQVLTWFAILAGLPKRGTATINHDFALPSAGMESLWQGYLQSEGVLVPPDVAYGAAKRHRWIPEDANVSDIVARVEAAMKAETETAPAPEFET